MTEKRTQSLEEWYDDNKPAFEGLTQTVVSTLKNLVEKDQIDYLSVSG